MSILQFNKQMDRLQSGRKMSLRFEKKIETANGEKFHIITVKARLRFVIFVDVRFLFFSLTKVRTEQRITEGVILFVKPSLRYTVQGAAKNDTC